MNDQQDTAGSPRLGLILFGIYLAFYIAFVFISAFACNLFEVIVFGGLNLAIVYGFGLIILALVLAGIYGGLSNAARQSSAASSVGQSRRD